MKILLIDNYDSFTYNIEHYLRNYSDVDVVRVDKINISKLITYDKIVLSPGPGLPKDRGELHEIIDNCVIKEIPLLGICLGHQAIAEYFGAKLFNMQEVNHGIEKNTKIINDDSIYNNIPNHFMSGRYHSWAVDSKSITKEIIVTSIDNDNVIMSLRHNSLDIKGIQFHPESVLTKYGFKILENWAEN